MPFVLFPPWEMEEETIESGSFGPDRRTLSLGTNSLGYKKEARGSACSWSISQEWAGAWAVQEKGRHFGDGHCRWRDQAPFLVEREVGAA